MASPINLPTNPLSSLGVSIPLDIETAALEIAEGLGLDKLFTNGYDFKSLKYPDDLEHLFMHGHYVNFYINVHRASKYLDPGDGKDVPASYSYNESPSNYTPMEGGTSSVGTYDTQRISQAISLYVPDSMNYSQSIEWENASLLSFGKDLVNSAASAAGIFSPSDAAGKGGRFKSFMSKSGQTLKALDIPKHSEFILNSFGYALNQQLLVLFRGINFRTFQYDFYFAPKSERESRAVSNIIKAFRFHAHPEDALEDNSIFLIAPSTFDIEFWHKGEKNKKIHQVKTCILKDYTVDYAPFGWSTLVDGMPVQTRLSLTFQETEIVTKQDIEDGF